MELTPKTPWHLWVVGVLGLLWNSVGIMSYMSTRLGKLGSLGFDAGQIAYFDAFPVWANAFWALGVWGAFVGTLLLLFRSRWAVASMMISVVGLIGTTSYRYFMTEIPDNLRNPGGDAAIWVITLLLLWYALRMRAKGVLR